MSSNGGPYLVWEDITVVAPNNNKIMKKKKNYNINISGSSSSSSRKVINELSGYAEPNRIMALMGPSGSGKSTLLDVFAGNNYICN